jgi:hypothetical protein
MKKAQSISINTIIIAALALLVLVIVAFIYMGGMGKFSSNKDDCLKNSGSCDFGRTCPSGYTQHAYARCYYNGELDPTNSCCVRVE